MSKDLLELLNTWEQALSTHAREIGDYLSESKKLHEQYSKHKKNKSEIGFNIFTLTSDIYYRENFHSDIIKALLDPRGAHKEGTKYLYLFIDLLNSKGTQEQFIQKEDFCDAIVEREKHRIDISIIDKSSKKAIIVENKINGAVDQKRQLPGYFEKLEEDDYKVVAVVYLTLNEGKTPDKSDWNGKRKEIDRVLKVIPAFDTAPSTLDIYNNWIIPSIIESESIDSELILRQYGKLIKYLNTNAMDTISMKKFHATLMEDDKLQTAISIRNMLTDLPAYLARKVKEKYEENYSPFKRIFIYQNSDTVFAEFQIEGTNFKLDVRCNERGYDTSFWENPKRDENDPYDVVSKFKGMKIFSNSQADHSQHTIRTNFKISEEKELFEFIDGLLEELKGHIKG